MSNVIAMSSYHEHYKPEEHTGICVVRRKGEPFEVLMKRFRKIYAKSGITKELHDRMYYEKPGDKKRRKKAQSIRLAEREAEKAEKRREQYLKMKAKQKRKREKAKQQKGEQNDQRTGRQNSSRVSKTDNKRRRSVDSGPSTRSTGLRKSVVNG